MKRKVIIALLSILITGGVIAEGKSEDLSKVTLNNDQIYEKIKSNEIDIDEIIMLRGTITTLKEDKLTFHTKEKGRNGYYEVIFDSIDKEIVEGNKVNLKASFKGKNKLGFPILEVKVVSKL